MSLQRELLGLLLLVSIAAGCSTVRVERRPGDANEDPSELAACSALRLDLDAPATNDGVNVNGAASGPDCSSTLVGVYAGSIDIGGPLPPENLWTGWVARVDELGEVTWRRTLADAADKVASARTVLSDGAGNVWVSGRSDGALLIDGVEALQGNGEYVVALGTDGTLRWAARLPGYPAHGALYEDGSVSYFVETAGELAEITFDGASGTSTVRALAAGSVGLMGGATRGDLSVLIGCTSSELGIGDLLVEKHDQTPDGNGNLTCDLVLFMVDRHTGLRWLRTFDEQGFSPYLASAAIDGAGEVALIASFWGQIDLGDGLLSASSIGSGMRLLVATFSDAGELREADAFGEATLTMGFDVVPKSDIGFAVSGQIYDGSVDFGDVTIDSGELQYVGFQLDVGVKGELTSSKALPGLEGIFESGEGSPYLVRRRMSDDGLDLGVTLERAGN
jgi:hypothetical protein